MRWAARECGRSHLFKTDAEADAWNSTVTAYRLTCTSSARDGIVIFTKG